MCRYSARTRKISTMPSKTIVVDMSFDRRDKNPCPEIEQIVKELQACMSKHFATTSYVDAGAVLYEPENDDAV